MKTKTFVGLFSMVVAIIATASSSAQPAGFDPANFDPAMIQKRIVEGYRNQLDVKSDDEWSIIQERIQKVLDARRAATPRPGGFGGFGGMGAMFGGGGGPRRESSTNSVSPEREERRQRAASFVNQFLPPVSPEEEALRKAVDANASKEEIKAALAKVNEVRKARQAALDKALESLREVLTVQQEAIATLNGLL